MCCDFLEFSVNPLNPLKCNTLQNIVGDGAVCRKLNVKFTSPMTV